MAARILSFFRPAPTTVGDWSQQELAEFYRVEAASVQAGLRVCTDRGLTDEGEPWFVFCRSDDGGVFLHIARVEGLYVIAGETFGETLSGPDFRALLGELTARHPVLLPITPQDRHTTSKVLLHPAALLTAIVATACLLSSMGEAVANELSEGASPDGAHRPTDAFELGPATVLNPDGHILLPPDTLDDRAAHNRPAAAVATVVAACIASYFAQTIDGEWARADIATLAANVADIPQTATRSDGSATADLIMQSVPNRIAGSEGHSPGGVGKAVEVLRSESPAPHDESASPRNFVMAQTPVIAGRDLAISTIASGEGANSAAHLDAADRTGSALFPLAVALPVTGAVAHAGGGNRGDAAAGSSANAATSAAGAGGHDPGSLSASRDTTSTSAADGHGSAKSVAPSQVAAVPGPATASESVIGGTDRGRDTVSSSLSTLPTSVHADPTASASSVSLVDVQSRTSSVETKVSVVASGLAASPATSLPGLTSAVDNLSSKVTGLGSSDVAGSAKASALAATSLEIAKTSAAQTLASTVTKTSLTNSWLSDLKADSSGSKLIQMLHDALDLASASVVLSSNVPGKATPETSLKLGSDAASATGALASTASTVSTAANGAAVIATDVAGASQVATTDTHPVALPVADAKAAPVVVASPTLAPTTSASAHAVATPPTATQGKSAADTSAGSSSTTSTSGSPVAASVASAPSATSKDTHLQLDVAQLKVIEEFVSKAAHLGITLASNSVLLFDQASASGSSAHVTTWDIGDGSSIQIVGLSNIVHA